MQKANDYISTVGLLVQLLIRKLFSVTALHCSDWGHFKNCLLAWST